MDPRLNTHTGARDPIHVGQISVDESFLAEVRQNQRVLYPALLDCNEQHLKGRGEANPMVWFTFRPCITLKVDCLHLISLMGSGRAARSWSSVLGLEI
jgi:hypothetical protein